MRERQQQGDGNQCVTDNSKLRVSYLTNISKPVSSIRRLIPFHDPFSLKICRESRGQRGSTTVGTPTACTPKTFSLTVALSPFVVPTLPLPTRGSFSTLAFRHPIVMSRWCGPRTTHYLDISEGGLEVSTPTTLPSHR